ncbi:MAG: hypothetical protein AAF723_02710 [Pseudomonadota bacterium]
MRIHHRLVGQVVFLLFLILLLLLATAHVRAQITAVADENITDKNTLQDISFFAGQRVTLSTRSTDDIVAAAEKIRLTNAQAEDIFLAASDVELTGVKADDVFIATADALITSGHIQDDLIIAASDIRLEKDARIDGATVLAAKDIDIFAPLGGELRATASDVWLDAVVGDHARLVAKTVTIGPNARIEGDLRYRADEFSLDPAAVISGEVIELPRPDGMDSDEWAMQAAKGASMAAIAFLIGIVLLVVVIVAAFPALINRAQSRIVDQSLSTLGLGVLFAIGIPFLLILLIASIVGIPIAILTVSLFIVALPLAFAAVAYGIAISLRRRVRQTASEATVWTRVGWSLLGAFLLILVGLIPVVGPFLWIIAYVIGLGAVFPAIFTSWSNAS